MNNTAFRLGCGIIFEIICFKHATLHYSWGGALPSTKELRTLLQDRVQNILDCKGEECSRIPSKNKFKTPFEKTV